MAVAAAPAYLGKDFRLASPGLRFGMFLPLWGVDGRSGELLWTTHDINYRSTGPQNQERRFEDKNKTAALAMALRLNGSDLAAMSALVQRQAELAAPLAEQGRLLTQHAVAVAPFTSGLGNAHPLENGFAFLNPYGLPYLPGSGVKGVVRQSARELADHLWGDDLGWTTAAIEALFGKTGEGTDAHGNPILQRGALMFWDVLPQIAGDALQVEVMTPHQTHYYQNGDSPHESGQPNPIHFLSVPPGSKFVFHVQCDLPFLAGLSPALAQQDRWQHLLTVALAHAFQWLGFGAKTAVGYGAMQQDEAARQRQALQAAAQRLAAAAQAQAQRRSTLSPAELEAEDAQARIAAFRSLLDTERQLKSYKAGSAFDQQRATLLQAALALNDPALRRDAAQALCESYKFTDWPGKKDRKQEVKQSLTQLDGLAP